MFDDIAGTYDTANRVLSMGIDIQWRKKACDETFARYTKPIDLIVDVACGTGDMMGYWAKQAKRAGREIGKILGVGNYLCGMVLPFNLIQGIIFSVSFYLVYRAMKPILKKL